MKLMQQMNLMMSEDDSNVCNYFFTAVYLPHKPALVAEWLTHSPLGRHVCALERDALSSGGSRICKRGGGARSSAEGALRRRVSSC